MVAGSGQGVCTIETEYLFSETVWFVCVCVFVYFMLTCFCYFISSFKLSFHLITFQIQTRPDSIVEFVGGKSLVKLSQIVYCLIDIIFNC